MSHLTVPTDEDQFVRIELRMLPERFEGAGPAPFKSKARMLAALRAACERATDRLIDQYAADPRGWCDATAASAATVAAEQSVAVNLRSAERVWVICELVPQRERILVAYEMGAPHPELGLDYFIDEHNCPTNITSAIDAVLVGRDDDVHGLFRYTGVIIPARVSTGGGTTGDDYRWIAEHAPQLFSADTQPFTTYLVDAAASVEIPASLDDGLCHACENCAGRGCQRERGHTGAHDPDYE